MTISQLTSTIYIFGGYSKSLCNNELWAFNIDRGFWQKLNCDPCPPPRANHTAVMLESSDNETMIIIGGINDNLVSLNDVWLYSVKSSQWTPVRFKPEDLLILPRSEHTAVIHENSLIVFGGRGQNSKELNDIMALNLSSLKWSVESNSCFKPSLDRSFTMGLREPSKMLTLTKISDTGFEAAANAEIEKSPSPVSHLSSSPKKDSKSPLTKSPANMRSRNKAGPLKLKAVDIENKLEEMKLLTPTTSSMLHSIVMNAGEKSLELYMQTMKRRKKLGATYVGTTEGEICVKGRIPCARSGHSADIYGNYMIVFGGDRGQMALNDIYIYELK